MAHKKGAGSSKNGRDSNPQYLGVKAYGGQFISAGSIIPRAHKVSEKKICEASVSERTIRPSRLRFRGFLIGLIAGLLLR